MFDVIVNCDIRQSECIVRKMKIYMDNIHKIYKTKAELIKKANLLRVEHTSLLCVCIYMHVHISAIKYNRYAKEFVGLLTCVLHARLGPGSLECYRPYNKESNFTSIGNIDEQ